MRDPYLAVDDVVVLPSSQRAPGQGVLPVNAYLVDGDAPLLVDTGLPADGDELLGLLSSLVDPSRLATVFLTHEDADHAGNLSAVLEAAPSARLVTSYVTLSRVLEGAPVPLDRVHVVDHGGPVPGTDGRFVAWRPPVYDSPGTLGLHDTDSGAVLTVDAFGTYLPELVRDLRDVGDDDVVAGLAGFNKVNHPWTALADRARLGRALGDLAALRPSVLLSSHGAVARDRTQLLLDTIAASPAAAPYVPPDQAAFEAMRPELEG